jgi:hypothetical protein
MRPWRSFCSTGSGRGGGLKARLPPYDDELKLILSMWFMICGAVFGISARSVGLTEQI